MLFSYAKMIETVHGMGPSKFDFAQIMLLVVVVAIDIIKCGIMKVKFFF